MRKRPSPRSHRTPTSSKGCAPSKRCARTSLRSFIVALLALALPAGGAPVHEFAPLALIAPRGPLLAGSRFPLLRAASPANVQFALLGPGSLDGGTYVAPAVVQRAATAYVVAAGPGTAGAIEISLAPAPPAPARLFAVASYDDGIALHRRSDGALVGIVGTDGGVADVARSGDIILAPAIDSERLWRLDLRTLQLSQTPGASTANEIAATGQTAYVTERDVAGRGALARIEANAPPTQTVTGTTAEGLALDVAAGRAYVANVNDDTVVAVDLATLRVVRRFPVPTRPFGVSLDAPRGILYVVSNHPARLGMPGGAVVALRLRDGKIVARSRPLVFPLGVAYDSRGRRVFVTDEATGSVWILDGKTLASAGSPLRACRVPWRPAVDERARRLYVPCAQANALAIFNLDGLRPLAGSPFATGGYPLGVSP